MQITHCGLPISSLKIIGPHTHTSNCVQKDYTSLKLIETTLIKFHIVLQIPDT